jgi:PAS domain S-box-containing protein
MADMRYRQILEDMEEGYYEIDLNGTFIFVNKIVCDIAEAAREELIGMNYSDYTSKATARRVFKTFNKVFETGFPQRIEYEIILKNSKRKIIENSVSLLRDNGNNVKGFCGLVSDITRRKRLQEQLRENRERFEALFENANELIITTDAYGYIRRMNKKVEEISVSTPFVLSASKGMAEQRIPNMRGIMSAKTKPLQVLPPVASDGLAIHTDFRVPAAKTAVKMVDPSNMDELVRLLHEEAKVI